MQRPANAAAYQLTPRGLALRQVVDALAAWGLDALGEPRPTDAVRTHWFTGGGPAGRAAAPVEEADRSPEHHR